MKSFWQTLIYICLYLADVYHVRFKHWFEDDKPGLLEKNALMNLPYIVDGDFVLTQTDACINYLGRLGFWFAHADVQMRIYDCIQRWMHTEINVLTRQEIFLHHNTMSEQKAGSARDQRPPVCHHRASAGPGEWRYRSGSGSEIGLSLWMLHDGTRVCTSTWNLSRVIKWVIEWVSEWEREYGNARANDVHKDRSTYVRLDEWVSEWVSEWGIQSGRVKDWVDAWVHEWASAWVRE